MSTRRELPWDLIAADIDCAIRMYCKSEYCHTRNLALKVLEEWYIEGGYSNLIDPNHTSLRAVSSRITKSCRKRGWREWSGNGERKTTGTKVFVIPKEVRR